jgi:hypothetical protein
MKRNTCRDEGYCMRKRKPLTAEIAEKGQSSRRKSKAIAVLCDLWLFSAISAVKGFLFLMQ